MFLLLATSSYAKLHNNGTDSLGNQLIYDDVLDITWYDYTNSLNTWQNQLDWADALSVDFGGTTFDDWRLPTTVAGPYVPGYDGSTTAGFNITSSEMGYLFYTELGNNGAYDTSGVSQPDHGLENTGDFQNLFAGLYWSETEYYPDPGLAWHFNSNNGIQGFNVQQRLSYSIAVRDGNVTIPVVPEPISSTLFLAGGSMLAFRRFTRS